MQEKQAKEIANHTLEAIGGKENISTAFHCVTRLRFVLKDESKVDLDKIKRIPGTIGFQKSGDQYQVIIGPEVGTVFDQFNIENDVKNERDDNSTEGAVKKKITLKTIGSRILDAMVGSITPALPAIICAGMIKMILMILGPAMIGLLSMESGTYQVLNFVGDAGFYFLPVFLGYTSAKKFSTNPIIGMLMGSVLIAPSFMDSVANGTALTIFRLPVTPVNYSSTVIPIILIVWIMSYVEKFFDTYIPNSFKMIFVPVLTVLVMIPLAFVVLGPIGSIFGNYISAFLLWTHQVFGPLGIGLIAAVFALLIVTGMHHAINMAVLVTMASTGYDEVVFVAVAPVVIAIAAAALAFALKSKQLENRSLGFSSFVLQVIGGIAEPTLYGIMIPYVRPFIAEAIGAFCGAVYMGFMHVKFYALTGSNIFILAGFIHEDSTNFVHAVIGCTIAFVVTFVLVWVIGFKEKEQETFE
ncbi:PTS transporter subunit EIIC (plasmid) [Enterococcus sp. 22-H-5-01]|uniref:PTS transporter subunit EIIC n=1 Tax=Enterococcus sp. 22-H-5-01 TaxID=3418555 RepID=UPI003D052AD6